MVQQDYLGEVRGFHRIPTGLLTHVGIFFPFANFQNARKVLRIDPHVYVWSMSGELLESVPLTTFAAAHEIKRADY